MVLTLLSLLVIALGIYLFFAGLDTWMEGNSVGFWMAGFGVWLVYRAGCFLNDIHRN